MYGVPEQLDLAPFIGTTLDHIGVGKFQIQFVFSGDLWTEKDRVVTVEGYWEVRDAQSAVIDKATENNERDVYRIHRLLSRTVTEARRHGDEKGLLSSRGTWWQDVVRNQAGDGTPVDGRCPP
jgi:hypothetical protein